jgi:hypothetical protein
VPASIGPISIALGHLTRSFPHFRGDERIAISRFNGAAEGRGSPPPAAGPRAPRGAAVAQLGPQPAAGQRALEAAVAAQLESRAVEAQHERRAVAAQRGLGAAVAQP